MRIGELATKAAVNIQTVRFYERTGILKEPPRSRSGYRCYSESDLEALIFIRRSQDLGFPLHEISQLLPLHSSMVHRSTPKQSSPKHSPKDGKPREMQAMASVARSRLEQVDQKLRLLKTMRAQLLTFVAQLEAAGPTRCLAPVTQPSNSRSSFSKKKSATCPA
jgi:MerR family transcriptional regulator, mercuric resistance operon regulatory protein